MPLWLEIAKGPIFRFSIFILVLGLIRLVVLTAWNIISAVKKAGDKNIPYVEIIKETLSWLFPFSKLKITRGLNSYASFGFHLGIIFATLFLRNHIEIMQANLGLAWPAITRVILDVLTLVTIFGGFYLLAYRIYVSRARQLSNVMDYILLVMLLNLFISGYIAGRNWNPISYDGLMLFHTLNGIVLLTIIPFTKIAHCVLFPLVRLGSEIAWRLTPKGGEDVIKTLYGPEGRKI